ncbi:3-oxoacyl-ACP synthase [Gordonia sp. TBRC 11910]|uniref:3-oxoacyl-ACP synthase n=1 Tax=Gordonia asplenii TaxID=2725283 RepID=A0A848L0Q6_9ACTN|nr:beta-ketoacyl synthase N-terminal-like domain-containing protein [Gordonia asplenii]NMO02655.1 3-oxoacyl-ACP synthase [Gordonia asplenii]
MTSPTPAHIIGLGAVSAYGWGRQALWNGLISGKSAAALLPGFGRTLDDPGWVASIADLGDPADGVTPFARAMRSAAREAIEDALERGWNPGARVGLIVASVLGDLDMYSMVTPGASGFSSRQYVAVTPSTPVSTLMTDYGFHGPAMTVSAMCTSGSAAVITAKTWLDSDMVDDVVVVAVDLSARREVVSMFVQLGVAITDTDPLSACRPFQEDSSGFIFGEAAIAMTLSRGTRVDRYGSVLGGALSHDGYHATSVDPSLTHVRGCVEQALSTARVTGDDIRYLNAHGPGTRQCDAAEGAIASEMLPNADVFSVKPLAGHCQAAAGMVELAATLLGYEHSEIPATPQTSTPRVSRLLDGRTPMESGLTLKTSLGMGGHNAALVVGGRESVD